MYRKILYIIFLVISHQIAIAQSPTPQDCMGAIPISQFVYDEPDPYAYSGNGTYSDEIRKYKNCITDENNGVWYIFNVQKSGALRFVINPHNDEDDYDWIVFDFSTGNCQDLAKNTSKYVISSNNYGSENNNGATGANSEISGGDAGNCNGPGDANGPKWNDDIPVYKGRTYLLYLSNHTGSKLGYEIDFSESTAQIFDDVGPELKRVVEAGIGNSELIVEFSEPINCEGLSGNNFNVFSGDKKIGVHSVEGVDCRLGAEYSKQFILFTEQTLEPNDYIIKINEPIYDLCGNPSGNSEIKTTVEDINFKTLKFSPEVCEGSRTGKIEIYAESPSSVLRYSIDGGKNYSDDYVFTGLGAGNYDVFIKAGFGYIKKIKTVRISSVPKLEIDSTTFSVVKPCHRSDNGSIKLIVSGGSSPIRFSIDQGETFTENNHFGNLKGGSYKIIVKDNAGCVAETEEIKINAPEGFTPELIEQSPSCFGKDDGKIEFIWPSVSDSVRYSIDGGKKFSFQEDIFDSLPAGNYRAVVRDKKGCLSEEIEILFEEPSQLKLDSVARKNVMDEYRDEGGKIIAYASGGTGNIEYILDSQLRQAENEFLGVAVGSHFVSVTDENACPGDKTIRVEIEIEYFLEIPKAFTPNGDGINEIWEIGNLDLFPDTEIMVYDRWQKLVYYSRNSQNGWNGTFNGKKLPTDSYYYIIDLKNGKIPVIGYVTLIR